MADGGTLYLDDVDDIPLEMQVKLLRAIEQREIERVGSAKPIPIDVRIIASTKKELRKLAAEGLFREDLFYRLNIFPINLRPLRERKNDIKLFIDFFVNKFSENKNIRIDKDVYDQLESYNWPGNVREIKNIAERISLLSNDNIIDLALVPIEICNYGNVVFNDNLANKTLDNKLKEIEIKYIQFALKKCKNNKAKAASILGIPPTTLHSKMNKFDLH